MNTGKSTQEIYKNCDMANMLNSVEPYLETAKGKFGYALARNVRKLRDACLEFLQLQQNLIAQLGEEEKDEAGNSTGNFSIKIGTPACEEYLKQIGEYVDIEHSVEIYKVPYDLLPDSLTAKDLLALDWMLYDADE